MKKILFLAALFTATVMNLNAETVTNVKYIDANGKEQTCAQATLVESSEERVTWEDGWYVVTGADVILSNGAACEGHVNLILADGAKLTATGGSEGENGQAGIRVFNDYQFSLTIYGQQSQSGILIATGGAGEECGGAGIGGNGEEAGAHITINGGTITATGTAGNNGPGAGIGGGGNANGENITINGGIITANGANADGTGGAGIGGGNPSDIYINGGIITANGGYSEGADNGPAIGGVEGQGYNIYVNPSLLLKADDNNPPTTEIAPDRTADTDIAEELAGKQFATIAPITPVTYIKADGTEGSVTEYTVVESSEEQVTWEDGWYVVTGTDVTLSGGAVCKGHVNLILADGAKLTANGTDDDAGIEVSDDDEYPLTIYGQKAQTGALIAQGGDGGAGIGSKFGEGNSPITINGGVIIATGDGGGAGIGSGNGGYGSFITINGGTVTATGGNGDDGGGAGIGSGYGAYGAYITINGGTVTATGGDNGDEDESYGGAGIGSGGGGNAENITITGGTVTATGGTEAAGIGGGSGTVQNIYINGGTVIATAGKGDDVSAIGAFEEGDGASDIYVAANVVIMANGTVIEHEDGDDITDDLVGIQKVVTSVPSQVNDIAYIDADLGAQVCTTATLVDPIINVWTDGWYVVNDTIALGDIVCAGSVKLILADGAILTAAGSEKHAGVQVTGDANSLTIYAQAEQTGKLVATGGKYATGIGSAQSGDASNITIHGGVIEATGYNSAISGSAGIGGNNCKNITIKGGTVTAIGGRRAAGIGSNTSYNATNITISGGTVTATGGSGGAGIGGGAGSSGSNITISGGTVTATGGLAGAGIGGGQRGVGSNITISGGTVTAIGGEAGEAGGETYGIGHAIGNGYKSDPRVADASNIFVDPSSILKADNNNPPTTVIAHASITTDIASLLAGQRYATVAPGVQIALAAEYGTFVSANTLALPEGLQAYSCAEVSAQGVLQLVADTKICENTPYILKGTAGTTYTCEITSTGTYTEPVTVGLLTGVYADTDLQSIAQSVESDETAYVLALQDSRVAFYSLENQEYTQKLPANRCYLTTKTQAGSQVKSVLYFDEETAIESIHNAEFIIHNDGKFLENGRVVIVKNNKKFNVAGQMIK